MTKVCTVCNMSFQTKSELDHHARRSHQNEATISFINNQTSKTTRKSFVRMNHYFNCCYCSYKTEFTSNLIRHLKSCKSFIGNSIDQWTCLDDTDESLEIPQVGLDEERELSSEPEAPQQADSQMINEVYLERNYKGLNLV